MKGSEWFISIFIGGLWGQMGGLLLFLLVDCKTYDNVFESLFRSWKSILIDTLLRDHLILSHLFISTTYSPSLSMNGVSERERKRPAPVCHVNNRSYSCVKRLSRRLQCQMFANQSFCTRVLRLSKATFPAISRQSYVRLRRKKPTVRIPRGIRG